MVPLKIDILQWDSLELFVGEGDIDTLIDPRGNEANFLPSPWPILFETSFEAGVNRSNPLEVISGDPLPLFLCAEATSP